MGADRELRKMIATRSCSTVAGICEKVGLEWTTIGVLISDDESTSSVYTASGATRGNFTDEEVGVMNLSMMINAIEHLCNALGVDRKLVAEIISGEDQQSPLAQRITGQRTARRPSGQRGRPR